MLAAADLADEVRGTVEPLLRNGEPANPSAAEYMADEGLSIEALGLRMAGLSYAQIGDRLKITEERVIGLVDRQLEKARNQRAEQMRALENMRLDRLQAAVWPAALKGDVPSVNAFLAISARRSRMNGLDAPKAIALSVNVKAEMHQALEDLRSVVFGEVLAEDAQDRGLPDIEDDRDDD